MPHAASDRRREFLRFTLSQNANAHSRDAQADMKQELDMLDSFYGMDSDLKKPDRDPELLADQITEPDPKATEVKIDTSKFNS